MRLWGRQRPSGPRTLTANGLSGSVQGIYKSTRYKSNRHLERADVVVHTAPRYSADSRIRSNAGRGSESLLALNRQPAIGRQATNVTYTVLWWRKMAVPEGVNHPAQVTQDQPAYLLSCFSATRHDSGSRQHSRRYWLLVSQCRQRFLLLSTLCLRWIKEGRTRSERAPCASLLCCHFGTTSDWLLYGQLRFGITALKASEDEKQRRTIVLSWKNNPAND